jgi:hypothetical protein
MTILETNERLAETDLVQIGCASAISLINMDTLSIEKDSIPDGGSSDVIKRESGEVELPLANAMHQLDA